MKHVQLSKLQAATNAVVGSLVDAMHGSTRFRTDLHGSGQSEKTKPRRGSSDRVSTSRPLPPRQLRAIELLLDGNTIVATAIALGINESTIRRWKLNPRFQEEVVRRSRTQLAARDRAFDLSMRQLAARRRGGCTDLHGSARKCAAAAELKNRTHRAMVGRSQRGAEPEDLGIGSLGL